jgi:hypothetical protein
MSDKWARASLRITSETLNCDAITEALKTQPSFAANKGDPVSRHSPRSGVRDLSTWVLESGAGTGDSLEAHLAALLPFLEEHSSQLDQLRSECTLEISCGFSSGNGQGGFVIENDALAKVAQAGLDLVLDLYPPEREE